MWRNSVIRLPVTEAKFITKCSLFILLPGVIRQLVAVLFYRLNHLSVKYNTNTPITTTTILMQTVPL